MELIKAKSIAETIVTALKPHCSRIEVAGSIRRGKPFVHDIDIVAIPNNQGQFLYTLQQLGQVHGGKKILQLMYLTGFSGIVADIYIATPEIWATLLLIRTGSAAHNIMLCKRARSMGMTLHVDGTGLERVKDAQGNGLGIFDGHKAGGEYLPCATEADIFKALGLPYKSPMERE